MASVHSFLPRLLLLPLLATLLLAGDADSDDSNRTMEQFPCSGKIRTCNASLYHINKGLRKEEVAHYYSVNSSQMKPISHGSAQDYLITVPCSCSDVNGTKGYFYDTTYHVKDKETFDDISAYLYSGQAWKTDGIVQNFSADSNVTMHLICGCLETESQIVITYTVQLQDTLFSIATLLSARISDILSMNKDMIHNQNIIQEGWVLYVPMEPMELNGNPPPTNGSGRRHKWIIVIGVLSTVTLLSIITLVILLFRRKRLRSQQSSEDDPKTVSKTLSASKRAFSMQSQYLTERMEEVTAFESERAVIYSLEEIEEATNNFDETKIIGRGGYGNVFFGVLGEKEVAIKKMKSNKSKEFFAELKILCKIHHINVVGLLGYACGDDHLYLVYEYVPNGSLSDHLHDPLMKGHQPLSWPARTQIALDAAKGIEYIHDHTKARYVHRDIKTSNILLDEGLRAKVADFGLAKLVERSNEEEMIATRLVGTPGYLPPESVKELQVTTKTDVFAFGVVLAELITGQRALTRDNREPNKMKSLITVINRIFKEKDPEAALEQAIDGSLRSSYPMEDVYKMAEVAEWCLSEDAVNRPEIRHIVVTLAQITVSSAEWEASLGGNSQVFSGVFSGR